MDWDDVRLFLAITRGTTLSEASTRLHLSHSTVSRRLAALEARSNTPLFSRSAQGYTTTEAGKALYESAIKMEQDYLELTRRLAAYEGLAQQVVRVSAPDVLVQHLGPHLAEFRALAPHIVLELNAENSTVNLDRLETHVALRASRAPQSYLLGTRVGYTAWGVYVARTKRKVHLADKQLSWIGYGAQMADLPVAQWMRANVPEERMAVRTNSTVAAQAYARAGLGAACLWCLAGDSDPDLTRLTGPLRDVATDLWLLTHPDLRRSKVIARVRTFLAAVLRSERNRMEGRSG